ncbi:hypothetical protein LTR95_004143 [Oleoguttula sp. CCFEE 5521]
MDHSLQANSHAPSESIMDRYMATSSETVDAGPEMPSSSTFMTTTDLTGSLQDQASPAMAGSATRRHNKGDTKIFVSAEEFTALSNHTKGSKHQDRSRLPVVSESPIRPELLLDPVDRERPIVGYRERSVDDIAADGDDDEKFEVVYKPIRWGLPGNDRVEDSSLRNGSKWFADREYYSIDHWRRMQTRHEKNEKYRHWCVEPRERSTNKAHAHDPAIVPAPAWQNFNIGQDVYLNVHPNDNEGRLVSSYGRRVRGVSSDGPSRKPSYALSKRDELTWVDDGQRHNEDNISRIPEYKVVKEAPSGLKETQRKL